MGEFCSKNVHCKPPSKIKSTTTSSSSVDSIYDFELRYAPHTGEGECVKVLFAYLQIPYKEVFLTHPDAQTQLITRVAGVRGTLQCLRHLCKQFGMYPSDVITTEGICRKVVDLWRTAKEDFYNNNKLNIRNFYSGQLQTFLRELEELVIFDSEGIVCNQISMCDILVVTFIYNLFYTKKCKGILKSNAPRLKAFCRRTVNKYLDVYFSTRKFNLYI